MTLYVNTHAILQNLRNIARKNGTAGPKVMIVGATDSGKSSLCSLLTNYATRMGETVRCSAQPQFPSIKHPLSLTFLFHCLFVLLI